MVEQVVRLLNGRGHPIIRARDAGIEAEEDQVLVEYALARNLIIVTFDRDLQSKAWRANCRCLHLRGRERTARRRLAAAYDEVIRLFQQEASRLVTVTAAGTAVGSGGTPTP